MVFYGEPEQAVEHAVKLSVIWDAIVLKSHDVNDRCEEPWDLILSSNCHPVLPNQCVTREGNFLFFSPWHYFSTNHVSWYKCCIRAVACVFKITPCYHWLSYWSLGDLDMILKIQLSILSFWLLHLHILMSSEQCDRNLLMISQHCFL